MLNKSGIENALHRINDALAKKDIKGEICHYGGAVMCLVYDTRPSTKGLDAISHPAKEMRELISHYPQKRIRPATRFFVEEILGS